MNLLTPPSIDAHLQALIDVAVSEDMGTPPSDRTVELAIPEAQSSTATIVARKGGILAGTFLISPILRRYDPSCEVKILAADGAALVANQPIAAITASTRALLSAERVILNFLSHLCGIATLTSRYVQAIAHLPGPPVITDTRKTIPAFRALDKYAVRCGGGTNHRMGLYDGVMLKDNHLTALREKAGQPRSLAGLTGDVRKSLDPRILLWLEVDTLAQLKDALPLRNDESGRVQNSGGETPARAGADVILLDNFTPAQMQQAVAWRNAARANVLLEASGGITLENLPAVAATGVDRISIGALTHSAAILDLSMEFA